MWGLRSSWLCAPSCSGALPATAISSGKPADRLAYELLRSVLNGERYGQLKRNSYLDIKSPRDPGCMYRVPAKAGAGEGDRAWEAQGEPMAVNARCSTRC
jgi:hypothetical protein